MARKKKHSEQWLPSDRARDSLEARREREDKAIRAAGYVKVKEAELERQADAILSAANERVLAELAKHTALLESMQAHLVQPSNDPEYLKTLQTHEAQRNAIANVVQTIHIVPDGPDKTWVAVGLADPRNKAEAHDVARRMAEHFEAKIRSHEPEETTP